MYWQDNDFEPGECFEQYRLIADDYDNNAVLVKTMVDSTLYMTHYHYRQTYKDVPVEGGYASEHFDINEKLIYTNARFAIELDLSVTPQLSEPDAKQALLNTFPSQCLLAWEVNSWENELKSELGDSTATYEPTGELILALDNYKNLDFYVPASRYRLTYIFDVLMLTPNKHARYYVDANTGEVFRELSLKHHDGIAHITNTGDRIIDTRARGWPNNDFVLETDNGDMHIHTKKSTNEQFSLRGEIDKNDEPWDFHENKATTVHWYAMQAWSFFSEVFLRHGPDGVNGEVRVSVEHPTTDGSQTYYSYEGWIKRDYLTFDHYGGYSTGDYADVVAHEYTHGIIRHNLHEGLGSEDEPGAINESFADIFGLMAQRYTIYGEIESSTDWLTAIPGANARSLSDSKSYGLHNTPVCGQTLGNPDTYLGDYWTDYFCPLSNGDKHAKAGVQNHWFYLLSEGGTGTNDNDDSYEVEGIGEDDALLIAWFAMMFNLNHEAQYHESMEATIQAARLIFGECSNQQHQTIDAWYAVGLGEPSDCPGFSSIKSLEETEFCRIYPNPTIDNQITIKWDNHEKFEVLLFDLRGNLIFSYNTYNQLTLLELPDVSKGVYLLRLTDQVSSINQKIIVQ